MLSPSLPRQYKQFTDHAILKKTNMQNLKTHWGPPTHRHSAFTILKSLSFTTHSSTLTGADRVAASHTRFFMRQLHKHTHTHTHTHTHRPCNVVVNWKQSALLIIQLT